MMQMMQAFKCSMCANRGRGRRAPLLVPQRGVRGALRHCFPAISKLEALHGLSTWYTTAHSQITRGHPHTCVALEYVLGGSQYLFPHWPEETNDAYLFFFLVR